jgi:hypothetical protein
LSKWVHWLSKDQSANRSTTYYRCEETMEHDSGVAWADILITSIHPWVAQESKIQWLPAAPHNTTWMDHHHVCLGSVNTILVLHAMDVEKAYGSSASRHHCPHWDIRPYGWRYVSFG